ncbi:DUF2247 family protein [Undibacterium sp. Tian12W]|uniref:DUF2247 family protein n=1 Tax=Undibacterium sp. Tian12W TaxID=3413054 RepID=UPI003BEF814A
MRKLDIVDWGVILLGLDDIAGIEGRLYASDIANFAAHELMSISSGEDLFDVVACLALDSEISTIVLREQVEKICNTKALNLDLSKRKWRLVAMEYLLAQLSTESVYGLIELSGFWAAHEWSSDAPPSMLGKRNDISSERYHSKAHFEHVIEEHQQWLQKERTCLIPRNYD